MGLWDQVTRFLALTPQTLEERSINSFSEHPGLTEQLLRVQGLSARPWRAAGIREALGVPAVLRAVTLIANTTGMLSLEAYRNGERMTERPRLVVRPNPLSSPRDFLRDTAYNMATRGEAWWWVAARDIDGYALSLWPVNPAEVRVERNPADERYPIIHWRERRMPNADMIHITLLREPGTLRGVGPLQLCGAAVSVAVEAQEWAANFYAEGGYPSIVLHAEDGFEDEETPTLLKQKWTSNAPNTPQVIGGAMSIQEMKGNQQGAQMMEARLHQNGEVALMFGMPGPLLEYSAPGSSLTYRNIPDLMRQFLETCLLPNYLEPIEQAISDLLTRTTVGRFNVDALLRPDPKERYEIYKLGIDSGVLSTEEARSREGLAPGDVERAPVPAAPPEAIPPPIQTRRQPPEEVRCDGMATKRRSGILRIERCNRLLSREGLFVGICPRCKKPYPAAA